MTNIDIHSHQARNLKTGPGINYSVKRRKRKPNNKELNCEEEYEETRQKTTGTHSNAQEVSDTLTESLSVNGIEGEVNTIQANSRLFAAKSLQKIALHLFCIVSLLLGMGPTFNYS